LQTASILELLRNIAFLTVGGDNGPAAATMLPFNPIKLIVLITWLYLCLYIVQRIQYSSLVSNRYQTAANLGALFLGPIFIGILVLADVIFNYTGSETGATGRLKSAVGNIFTGIGSIDIGSIGKGSDIILMSSAGKELKEIYGQSGKNKRQNRHVLSRTEDVIFDGLAESSSDILIDPKNDSTYTVRFRVDGILRAYDEIDSEECLAVINSIKAVSSMDIAERRRPQDGSFSAKAGGRVYAFRVASAGVANGEKLSIRVLNTSADSFNLSAAGLTRKQTQVLKSQVLKPSGMILICGPTGSGKTSSLYAMLNEIDLFTRNVITVEDPIECVLPNASQIEINEKADITFAKSLRNMLRQDPDVICVGEIRDEETASIALRASQTGHLVFATIHSHSNASTLVRLVDLGVSPMLIASGLNVMMSQRLIRILCKECKKPAQLNKGQIESFRKRNVDYRNIYSAVGCPICGNTGYHGRTGIFDILTIDRQLKDALSNNKLPLVEMRNEGDKRGKSNLRKEGIRKVCSGVTSIEEIERVLG